MLGVSQKFGQSVKDQNLHENLLVKRMLRLDSVCSYGQGLIAPTVVQLTFIEQYMGMFYKFVACSIQSCEQHTIVMQLRLPVVWLVSRHHLRAEICCLSHTFGSELWNHLRTPNAVKMCNFKDVGVMYVRILGGKSYKDKYPSDPIVNHCPLMFVESWPGVFS